MLNFRGAENGKNSIIKLPIDKAKLKIYNGITGDSNVGNWHRQISVLAQESINYWNKVKVR